MRVLAGTSGYNFDEWRGVFYPQDLPTTKWLGFYSARLPTVEINYSFYRTPMRKRCRAGCRRRIPVSRSP